MQLSMKGTCSIKARVTAWFALIMFCIASAVFYVMIVHRSNQVKTDATKSLEGAVREFSDMVVRTDGNFTLFEGQRPRPDKASDGALQPGGSAAEEEDAPAPDDQDALPPDIPIQTVPENAMFFAGEGKKPRTYAGGVHMAVFSESGETLFGQIPFDFETMDFIEGSLREFISNGERYLILDKKVSTSAGDLWVKGVVNLSSALNAVNATLAADYGLITALIVIAAVGGYFIVGRALAPIAKMRKTAQEIADSSDLSRRIDLGDGKDEVYRLAAVFDEMMGKLQHAFDAEKQFTSDASHELRTPVAVILSECEYALDCAKTKEECCDSLTVVKRQGEKMSKLISELLTIARMDKTNLAPDLEKTDLSELADIVCDELSDLGQKDITLLRDIAPGVFAKADSAMIARLLINLISNAFEYGKPGGTVWVSLKATDTEAVFSVTDDGIGIAPEEIDKIWDRFYQVNKSRTNENGSMGLGLAMVKQIARLHGGSVAVKSTPEKGSTFTFTMPRGV